MRSVHTLSLFALAAAACGDPLVTAETRGDPLFSVRGTVSQGLSPVASTPLEVGVIWLNRDEGTNSVAVETTPADAIGATLPADFDVSILRAPSDRMLGTTLVSYTEDLQSARAIDRNRVAFGLLVVGPEGTLASLPAASDVNDIFQPATGTPGALLQRFTYVSPYTVRYVKGATAEGLTIRDANGEVAPLNDMTVFDVTPWAAGIEVGVCRDRVLSEGETASVSTCAEQQSAAAPGRDRSEIVDECRASYRQSRSGAADAACGQQPSGSTDACGDVMCMRYCEFGFLIGADGCPVCSCNTEPPGSDFRNVRRLGASEQVSMALGVGDVRNALAAGGYVFID